MLSDASSSPLPVETARVAGPDTRIIDDPLLLTDPFARALAQRMPLEAAAKTLCQTLARVMGCESCLLLLDDDWQSLLTTAPAPPSPDGLPQSGIQVFTREGTWHQGAGGPWSPFVIQALFSAMAMRDQTPHDPLWVNDLNTDTVLPQSVRAYCCANGLGSLGVWPLPGPEGTVQAHLLMTSRHPCSWQDSPLATLNQACKHLGLLLTLTRHTLDQAHALRRERLVGKVMGYLNQTFDVQSVLGLICKDIVRVLGADRCLILQYAAFDDTLPIQYVGQYCAHKGIEPVCPDDLPGEAILYSVSNLVLASEPQARIGEQIRAFNQQYGVQSSTAVQMMFRGAPMGMILVQQCHGLRLWDEDDMALLHTLAMELGGAFYLAERYRLTRQEHQAAHQAASRMNHTLASLAHEIRSPLHTVVSCAETLRQDILGAMSGKQREYVRLIEKSSQHVLGLINDMLDAARIQTGRFSLRAQAVDLQALLLDSIAMIRPQCEQKGQTLHVDLTTPLPIGYVGDPDRLSQVLLNVLTNAHQYTPPGGQISVWTQCHAKAPDSARRNDSDQCLAIHIADTGCGIPASETQNVFRPFYQAHPDGASSRKGLGLGLSIAKSIVELHGASITLHPRQPCGVEAVLTLPLCHAVSRTFAASAQARDGL